MKNFRRYLPLSLLTIALAGCGPSLDIGLTMQQFATNIVYGGHKKPAPTPEPVAGAPVIPGFPPFISAGPAPELPGVPPEVGTVIPTVPCPVAGPFDAPEQPATTGIDGGPGDATYRFKASGSGTKSDLQGKPVPVTFDPAESWAVKQTPKTPTPDGNTTYDFSITNSTGGSTTTTTFEFNNGHPLPNQQPPVAPPTAPPASPPPAPQSTGMLTIKGISNAAGDFTPQPPIEILPLPALGGETWFGSASNSSPLGGPQAWQYNGLIGQNNASGAYVPGSDKANVDACGHVLQGWNVTFHADITTGPNLSQALDVNYVIATQYGGLTVRVGTHRAGTDSSGKFDYSSAESAQETPVAEKP